MIQLRPYQADVDQKIDLAYAQGNRVVMPVLPTGAGKTILFTHRIIKFPGISMALAHRAELVTQMALSLARAGIAHRVVGPSTLAKRCARVQMEDLGKHFVTSNAQTLVGSVQTIDNKKFAENYPGIAPLLPQVGQWICDEGHHLLRGNAWGRVVGKMPNAIGLAPTATPERADGKGLGSHADGLADCIVEGPTQRDLIDLGFLTDYDIYAPPPSMDLSEVEISSSTGDFNQVQLVKQAHKQQKKLVGDLVHHYHTFAAGKLAICFVTDLETAAATAAQFKANGIRSEVISSKTDAVLRAQMMRQFKQGVIRVLVNVDILGEGVDVPAVEAVIMGRPTDSFSLFNQQAGRSLRILEGKSRAIIIDAVGNVQRHARVVEYPDGRTLVDLSRGSWTLDRREKRASRDRDPDEIPLKRCSECTKPYTGLAYVCPHCGYDNSPEPSDRSLETVDGDLTLLDPMALAALNGGKERAVQKYLDAASRLSHTNPQAAARQHKLAQVAVEAQRRLDNSIRYFAGYWEGRGQTHSQIYRRFYYRYGVDVATAAALVGAEAEELNQRICDDLAKRNLGCL